MDDAIGEGPTLLSGSEPAGGADAERLAAGARAGDYEIEAFIGAGAMGDVYAARHPLIGKRAAVKVIKRRLAGAADAVERFLREARAVNQVGHPSVVDVFAVGRLADGRLYLVMDLLEGEALGARLRRAPLSTDEALAILEPVAAAVDAAHARGVVHRDLKPDNVFLARRGDVGAPPTVYVLDFGIAKLLGDATGADGVATATLTDRGTWLGTPAYMAPEQWGADGAGPASDRYALGALAFELLAGRPPFHAATLPQMMEQHFRAPVPSLADTAQGPGLPAAVDDVLTRAMAKDPAQRFATGGELIAALRAALGTTAGRRARRPAAPTELAARGGRRTALVAVLGGAVVAAAIGTAIVVVGSGPRDAATPRAAPVVPAGDRLEIATVPAGAQVTIGGVARGVTPTTIEVGAGELTVTLTRPGYEPVTRTLAVTDAAPPPLRVSLQPITRFQGVWALPDGLLRAFERRGEQVAMFNLEAATGGREFARFFEFAPAPADVVVFVAAEEHVEPRGAADPSCHVPLQAEYRYDPAADALERRTERVRLDFADGRCALRSKEWGSAVALRRMATDADDDGWIESRAGTARASADKAPRRKEVPATVPAKPVQQDAQNAAPQKKAPPAKQAPAQNAKDAIGGSNADGKGALDNSDDTEQRQRDKVDQARTGG